MVGITEYCCVRNVPTMAGHLMEVPAGSSLGFMGNLTSIAIKCLSCQSRGAKVGIRSSF